MPYKRFSSDAQIFFSLMNHASSPKLQLSGDTNGFSATGSCAAYTPGPHPEAELMGKASWEGETSVRSTLTVVTLVS